MSTVLQCKLYQEAYFPLITSRDTWLQKLKKLTKKLNTVINRSSCSSWTSQLQTLGGSVNKPFKNNLKRLCRGWLHSGNRGFILPQNIKKCEGAQLCEWIEISWHQNTLSCWTSILKMFTQCYGWKWRVYFVGGWLKWYVYGCETGTVLRVTMNSKGWNMQRVVGVEVSSIRTDGTVTNL